MYERINDILWFYVVLFRVCFTYVIMWNDGVGYNVKNEILIAFLELLVIFIVYF